MFESTIAGVYYYIRMHISANTQTAKDITMHTHNTQTNVGVQNIKCIYTDIHTHNTENTIDIRMHERFTSDAHSSSSLLSGVYSNIHIHMPRNNQTTPDIWMHTWFKSDAHYPRCIFPHTHHLIHKIR